MDGQAASLHIGDRYPIITNSYLGSPSSPTGGVYTRNWQHDYTGHSRRHGYWQSAIESNFGHLDLLQRRRGSHRNQHHRDQHCRNDRLHRHARELQPVAAGEQPATSTGTLPATLTISPGPNLTALGTGSYLGTVQVSGSDGSVAYISRESGSERRRAESSLSPTTVTLTSSAGGLEVQQLVTVTQHQPRSAYGKCGRALVFRSRCRAPRRAPMRRPPSRFLGNPAGISAQNYAGILSVTVAGTTTLKRYQ